MLEKARLGRRTFLTAVGSGVAVAAGPARAAPLVTRQADGGFIVSGGSDPWNVSGAELQRAWGPQAQAEVKPATESTTITIGSKLIARAGAVLQLTVRSLIDGRWTVQATITIPTLGSFSGDPSIGASGLLLSKRVPVVRCLAALGLRLDGGGGVAQLELGRDLVPTLASRSAFVLPKEIRVSGRLQLMPGTGEDPAARIASDAFVGRAWFGQTAGQRIGIDAVHRGAVSVFVDGENRKMRIEGEMKLSIGTLRLLCSRSVIEIREAGQNQGRWIIDGALGPVHQRVSTRAGGLVVRGQGDSDVHIEGRWEQVDSLDIKAALVHSALRLPLTEKARSFADLGRLDFVGGPTVHFTVGNSSRATDGEGQVPLDDGAAYLPLDLAKLWVRRDLDMLDARFGFRGVGLRLAGREWRIVPSVSSVTRSLIVELPPQHVQEQAFARLAPVLPGRALEPEEFHAAFAETSRRALQNKLKQEPHEDGFSKFCKEYEARYLKAVEESPATSDGPSARLAQVAYPPVATRSLEAIYVGREGMMTPLGRQLARELATEERLSKLPLVGDLPLGLPEITVGDILRRHGLMTESGRQIAGAGDALGCLVELLVEAAKRNGDLARVLRAQQKANGNMPFLLTGWRKQWPNELRKGSPEHAVLVSLLSQKTFPEISSSSEALLQDVFVEPYKSQAPRGLPVEAQASGPTRLVFDFGAVIGSNGLPWCLESLLNWGQLELRVSTRASMLADRSDGRDELEQILKLQQIPPTASLQQRMKDIAARVQAPPEGDRTAIEVPARLVLSPASSARFVHTPSPATRTQLVPAWHADLREASGKPFTLRAIHSDDFSAEAFGDKSKTPQRGTQNGKPTGPLFALDDYDRHQLVALSSVYGLPALARRSVQGAAQTSQVSPPKGWEIQTEVLKGDAEEQALYVPQPLPTRLLRLSTLGASLDLEATFIPPASLRDEGGANVFDAFSVERWRSRLTGGREVTTEVVYKGFLYPLGVRASLVKVTERKYLPWRRERSGRSYPVAYLIQRLFIQVSKPTKTFPAVAQPFEGRGWPARALTILTRTTPDLVDPMRRTPVRPGLSGWEEGLSGRLWSEDTTGLIFWPRTAPGASGNVRFRLNVDDRPEPVSMPLLFVDNQAAHDPPTMRLLQRYYNAGPRSEDLTRPAWEALRRVDHAGARRRYAAEGAPGDTTFETLTWDVRADSRSNAHRPAFADQDEVTLPSLDGYRMNSAMESDDQPPFYPRCDLAQIRHDASAKFSGNPQPPMSVRFWKRYLEVGLPIVSESEWNNGSLEALAKARLDALDKIKGGKPDPGMVMREAFFTVLRGDKALPKLIMGDNGDRSGGVARPEVNIAAVGRGGPIGVKTATDQPPPDTVGMNSDFVDEISATVAGIVKIATLLKNAIGAVSPVLQDTLDYAVGEIASRVKPILDNLELLLAKFDSEPALVAAYAPTRRALQELQYALKNAASRPDVALAAVRTAAQEMERLAAAPLAPLVGAAETVLRDKRQSLANKAQELGDGLTKLIVPQAVATAAIARVLLPTTELESELERIIRLKAANPGATALQVAVQRAIGEISQDLLLRDPATLPTTLSQLRIAFGDQLKNQLPQLAVADDWKSDVIKDFMRNLGYSLDGSGPAFLRSLYGATRRWRLNDLMGGLAELGQAELAFLRGWSMTAGACSTDSITSAIEALKQGLLPGNKIPNGCNAAVCASSADLGSFCQKLLNLCAKLQSLRQTSTDLALALDALRVDSETLKPRADSCDELIRWLRGVRSSHDRVLAASRAWIDDLQSAKDVELQAAGVELLVPALADLLDTIMPKGGEAQSLAKPLAGVVGTELAGLIVDRLVQADKALSPLSGTLRQAKSIDDIKDVMGKASGAIVALRQVGEDVTSAMATMLALPAVSVANGWARAALIGARDAIDLVIRLRDDARAAFQALDKQVGLQGDDALVNLLVVGRIDDYGDVLQDRLLQERAFLQRATAANAIAPVPDLLRLLAIWKRSRPAALVLVETLERRLVEALRERALRLLNVDALRERLEEMLRSALPTKRTLAYSWTVSTGSPVTVGLAKINMPRLALNVSTTLDLRQPAKPAQAELRGELDDFWIQIGDWIKLRFSKTTFTGGPGRDVTMKAPRLLGFDPQPRLMFLAALALYLGVQEGGTAEPSGPYLIPRPGAGAGIKAGYRLSFGALQLGNVAILDLAFDAHAELPFNGDPGAVRILLSSPERPFLICAAPYGGSGYIQLMSGPEGKQYLNIALQWGGAAALAYGPLRATGKVMTGFRVRSSGSTDPIPSAMFLAAFEGHIACFGIAGSFVVTMEYVSNRLSGKATLTYSFSVGPVKKDFSVSVTRNAGQKLGDKESHAALGSDFGVARVIPVEFAGGPPAQLSSDVPAGMEDWTARAARYASALPVRGRRVRS